MLESKVIPIPKQAEPMPGISWVDTHAHIHFSDFKGQVDAVLHRADEADVKKIITVGINSQDSQNAVELASTYENVWATVGVHPHEAGEIDQSLNYLKDLAKRRKVVAIGECGLDFYKNYSSEEDQVRALRKQVELAQELELPVVFHVRDAFDQFFKIMNDYKVRGVVHSYTADTKTMQQIIERGWIIALNGIMTFSKDEGHRDMVKQIPETHLILETDCPFLSPAGFRGKQNEPARVADIGKFIAEVKECTLEELAYSSTKNAERLFGI